jgi:hypothetical protein
MVLSVAAVALGVVGFCGHASAAILYDNFDAPFSNANGANPFWLGPQGDSFSTGSAPFLLGTVQLLLSGDGTSGTITVDLLSDNNTSPGSVLDTIGTMSTDVLTTTPTVFAFTPPPGIVLSPNTRYWIQATGSGDIMSEYSPAAAAWDIEYPLGVSDVGVAGGVFEFPEASDDNYYLHGSPDPSLPDSVWPNLYGPNMMLVGGSEVPEPATFIIWSLLGGLGITIGRRCRRKAA